MTIPRAIEKNARCSDLIDFVRESIKQHSWLTIWSTECSSGVVFASVILLVTDRYNSHSGQLTIVCIGVCEWENEFIWPLIFLQYLKFLSHYL